MHCFASENQTYTGTWLFGVESWKSLKGQENLLLKNLQVKTRVENVRFLSWKIFLVGKYGIQSTNEMAFKRTVPLPQFSISRHQIWCAHAIVVQRIHACACKLPSCLGGHWHPLIGTCHSKWLETERISWHRIDLYLHRRGLKFIVSCNQEQCLILMLIFVKFWWLRVKIQGGGGGLV